MKKKYLINGFYFLYKLFSQELSEYFDFEFSPPRGKENIRNSIFVPHNISFLYRLYKSGRAAEYPVVHLNRPEAFWFFKPAPGQVSVLEAHGFDVGVLASRYLVDLHSGWKRFFGAGLDRLISGKIKKNIRKADIWYCSTPDLVEPLSEWCGRKPEWLPNPVDVSFFSPEGPTTKLQGSPAVFLAARLHGDKKPEVAIRIFQEEIKPRFKDATLHLISSGELVEKYKRELTDESTYVWHPYMTKDQLAAKLRGADLVFGDFSVGALGLLAMQVMALKRPIVTYDRYEAGNKTLEELPSCALKILEDAQFSKEWAQKAYQYVHDHHAARAIAERHLANLKRVGYAKGIALV